MQIHFALPEPHHFGGSGTATKCDSNSGIEGSGSDPFCSTFEISKNTGNILENIFHTSLKGQFHEKVDEFLTRDDSFSLNLGSPTFFKILKSPV
jgi:hypothetical protein